METYPIDTVYRKNQSIITKTFVNDIIGNQRVEHIGCFVAQALIAVNKAYNVHAHGMHKPKVNKTFDNPFVFNVIDIAEFYLDDDILFVQCEKKINIFDQVNEVTTTYIYKFNTSKKLTYKYEDIFTYSYETLLTKITVELSDELYKLRYGGIEGVKKLLT